MEKSPKTIHIEQQLQAAVLCKARLLAEEQIRELEDELRNRLELDVGFNPVTLEAELGKCSPSTPMLNEREVQVTGEEFETAEEYLRSFQAKTSVRASASASENTWKAGQLAAANGVGLVKQESCEDDLLIQDLESCQEEEREDEFVMHSTARTYDKHPNARHSILTQPASASKVNLTRLITCMERSTVSLSSRNASMKMSLLSQRRSGCRRVHDLHRKF